MKPTERGLGVGVFLISLAAIALQILLLRVFAIRYWHHFAHLVIGTGLLGFGLSGTLLALGRARLLLHPHRWLVRLACLFAVTAGIDLPVSNAVSFEPIRLPIDLQLGALLVQFLLVLLPFLCAGLFVGLALQVVGERVPRTYSLSLLGSGVGAPLALGGLYLAEPQQLVGWLGACGVATALLLTVGSRWPRQIGTRLLVLLSTIIWVVAVQSHATRDIELSEYKDLSLALGLPDATVVAQRFGPLGRLEVVASRAFHDAPGLSLNATGSPPPQRRLFIDGSSTGAVMQLEGDPAKLPVLAQMLSYLPFRLQGGGHALVLGAGGGGEILAALHAGMMVDAIEMNPQLVELMRGPLAGFSGDLYRRPGVRVIVGEARGFLRRPGRHYDLIVLPPFDAFGTSSISGFTAGESPLYTVESFSECLQRLSGDGVFTCSRWIRQPPRDGIRLIATAIAALETAGVDDPRAHLLVVRDWSQLLLLCKRTPWTRDEIRVADSFLDELSFDWVHHPWLEVGETNRFHQFPEAIFHLATDRLLGPGREAFLRDYPFAVQPPTDDHPFFFHSSKRGSAAVLARELGGGLLPAGEWSDLLLRWSTVQSALLAFLLLLCPLFTTALIGRCRARRRKQYTTAAQHPFGAYLFFVALGFGYLTLEISLLQRLSLFLAQPIFAATLVLAMLLCGSGVGSLVADRSRDARRTMRLALLGIVVLGLAYALLQPMLLEPLRGVAAPLRWLTAALLITPLGFLLGFPFPLALRLLSSNQPHAVPWAWGLNGFASVIATVAAAWIALSTGYTVVALTAVASYLVAMVLSPAPRIRRVVDSRNPP